MKHIALTLGPITDTLMLGRKTSEIWMASYLFSSFMKKTIKEIKDTTDAEFLVPYTDDDSIFETKDDGIGMFHDRFIFRCETTTIQDVEKILNTQKIALADMVARSIKKDKAKVEKFFQSYLQTYLFESKEDYTNPVLEISEILDSIELHTPMLETDEDYMRLFLRRDTVLQSELAKDSFGKKPSFESIEAISAQEEDRENFKAKNAQKYIAIIYADGDNLGAYIKSQKNVSEVSKKLFEFDKKAVKTICSYGGIPLFVGGDDLLIFAPVINSNKKTVFDLVNALSTDYNETLQTNESTLSFGVSITYYKYPLYEALAKSRGALFDLAKAYKCPKGNKNAVSVLAQKHSGQSFGFTLGKNEKVYSGFVKLINSVLNEELELPHAIHHKLFKHQFLFENIKSSQLKDTFENIFNEEIHQSKFKVGLELVRELMQELGTKERDKLFSMLSTIKLIRGDR